MIKEKSYNPLPKKFRLAIFTPLSSYGDIAQLVERQVRNL